MNDTAGRAAANVSAKQSKPAITIKSVGVIGAGQMGSGIAHVSAIAGYDVVMADISEDQLKRAMAAIDKNMTRQVSKGALSETDKTAALARIKTSSAEDAMKDRDLVIEAATESEEIKKKIFRGICPILKPGAILCSNTSSISITRLAAVTDRPAQFMGLHFMNPVPVMKLVELIRGIATEETTYSAVREFAAKLGKQTVSSEDFPAFIVNRILIPMINEAVYTLYEGVGSVKAIDTAMKLGANHPMGPLE
ncbi:MAG: NAD(P)-binding domain-containing protein, partial [Rhodospirillaceae bacterium]|nr:NAD(P)-binding domain-containing protein [Rhodospirillaceae bacterium]